MPKYYLEEDFYEETIDKLKNNAYSSDVLSFKYINLLKHFGKFINNYQMDINQIKKSTLYKINEYWRINALKNIAFSEEEDNTEEDNTEEDNGAEDNGGEEDNTEEDNTEAKNGENELKNKEDELKKENSKNKSSKLTNNTKLNELLEEIKFALKNSDIISEKAMINNDR